MSVTKEQPPDFMKHKVLEDFYQTVAKIREAIEEAKQNAVYAESLGADLGREADHVVNLLQARLFAYLLSAEILGWSMGYKIKHKDELGDIERLIKSETHGH